LGEAEIIPYLAGVIGALIASVAFLVWATMQRTEARPDIRDMRDEGRNRDVMRAEDRLSHRQSDQAEVMAGVVARLGQVEEGQSKLADALNRLTRLEEFRLHAMPKLEEAEETARTVIAFGEQMKTVFKRIDVMSEQMNKQSEKIDAIPDAVAGKLRAMVRPQSGSGRAA
jgi:hypothetical protein